MSKTDLIDVRREKAIAVVTLNRPRRRNALTGEVRAELQELLTCYATDPQVRGVVLGSREQAFSAGQDLGEAKDFRPEQISGWIDEHMRLYRSVAWHSRSRSSPQLMAAVSALASSWHCCATCASPQTLRSSRCLNLTTRSHAFLVSGPCTTSSAGDAPPRWS